MLYYEVHIDNRLKHLKYKEERYPLIKQLLAS